MLTAVVAIFALVYLGMILGGLPFLQLDRTGVALLGAIAIVGCGALTAKQAAAAVHLPSIPACCSAPASCCRTSSPTCLP